MADEALRALDQRSAQRWSKAAPRSGLAQLRLAVVVGLALAAAIVAFAVAFRPESSVPAANAVAPSQDVAAPAAARETPGATPIADMAVRLRVGPAMPEDRIADLREAAAAAGFARIELTVMPFPVTRQRVEFYRPADRAAAEALAATLGSAEVRDLGDAAPSAEPRRLDAWIAP